MINSRIGELLSLKIWFLYEKLGLQPTVKTLTFLRANLPQIVNRMTIDEIKRNVSQNLNVENAFFEVMIP